MSKHKDEDDDWGFGPIVITNKSIEDGLRKYNAPVSEHECKDGCSTHDFEEIWDDFNMSQRQREVMFMEVVRARGRYNKELTLIRRFQSTADGSYVLRLSEVGNLTNERMGDIHFDTKDEMEEYYNYCIGVFKFREVEPIVPEEEGSGFFDDLDEMGWGFDSDGEDDDDSWDIDEGDEDDPNSMQYEDPDDSWL